MNINHNRYYQNYRDEMIGYLPVNAKVFLEIGCGEGNFGLKVKESIQDSIFWAIELDEISAVKARGKIDKVLVGNCERIVKDLPNDFFDCVIFNDSLEHLERPFSLLEDVKSKMKANGHIVTSIPNFRYYKNLSNLIFKKDFKYVDAGILDRSHLRFFTKKSIVNMFHDHGYEIEMLEGINKARKPIVKFLVAIFPWLLDDILYMQFACRVRLN